MELEIRNLNEKWKAFTLKNDNGMEVEILNYGGIITKILAPDRNNNIKNVVLGYVNYENYENDPNFLGALIGRVAGRINNSSIQLKGKNIYLENNDGKHHLHGGSNGFHRYLWESEPFKFKEKVGVKLTLRTKPGEGNYPGNLKVVVTYSLTKDNQLILDYYAIADEATPLTLTNHSYFNLSGDLNSTIHDHSVTLDSQAFLELNKELIPTGKTIDTTNSLFDFQKERVLNEGILSKSGQNAIAGNGYDHYFILDHKRKKSVIAKDKKSGRILSIITDQPGIVLYTGQNLVDGLELAGGTLKKYSGVCFETQSSPASLYIDDLPSILLKANEPYHKRTTFVFSIEK